MPEIINVLPKLTRIQPPDTLQVEKTMDALFNVLELFGKPEYQGLMGSMGRGAEAKMLMR